MPDHMQEKKHRPGRSLWFGWNRTPNLVTYIRIALVAALIACALRAGPSGSWSLSLRWAAFCLFVVAAYTDRLDGWLARKNGEITELGKLLDPIADKLLVCGTLVILSAYRELAWWITILFLVREIGITVLRFVVIDTRCVVIPASQAGKYKTLTECVGIAMLLLPVRSLGWVTAPALRTYNQAARVMILVALALCLFSGVEYLVRVLTASNNPRDASRRAHRGVSDSVECPTSLRGDDE